MKKSGVLFLLILLILCAFKRNAGVKFNVPTGWPKPAYNFKKNPLTTEKLLLGRALFYDPILSRDSTISCNSCHSQYAAFTHIDHALSHGIDSRIGTRNSPAIMNLAWQNSFMWDGKVGKIVDQAVLPITHPDEMGETMTHVLAKLKNTQLYPAHFYKAFGDSSITDYRLLEAIAQFMVSLVSANSKYDSVMRGEAVFTTKEQNGYRLFKTNCAACHTEPLFTNGGFENNGLPIDSSLNDFGRYAVTHNPEDSFKFKVPTLRNIELSPPYMHDGRFNRLYEVINHYSKGIKPSKNLSVQLQKPIELNGTEKVDLVAFLMTLTDKHFIFNPDYNYPKNTFSKTE